MTGKKKRMSMLDSLSAAGAPAPQASMMSSNRALRSARDAVGGIVAKRARGGSDDGEGVEGISGGSPDFHNDAVRCDSVKSRATDRPSTSSSATVGFHTQRHLRKRP